MFPLKDENPTELIPFVTLLIIAANVATWLLVQGAGSGAAFLGSLCEFGAIPGEITGAIPAGDAIQLGAGARCRVGGLSEETLITSMFMHGSWMHLIGNMWFLWVFGNNIEDSMGHLRYIVFYLLTGVLAAGAHVMLGPDSPIPTVGASGAISGIMGAYMVLYPRIRVHTAIVLFVYIRVIPLPAWTVLLLWFLLQLAEAAFSFGGTAGGVAFGAHIGGFVAGALLVKLFGKRKLVLAKQEGRVLTRDELGRFGGW
jgi:membrane associated rhomboid family serine protease